MHSKLKDVSGYSKPKDGFAMASRAGLGRGVLQEEKLAVQQANDAGEEVEVGRISFLSRGQRGRHGLWYLKEEVQVSRLSLCDCESVSG